jgi:hypothetical protein
MLRFRNRLRLIAFSDTTGAEFFGASLMVWAGIMFAAPHPTIFNSHPAWSLMAMLLEEHAWGVFFCVVGGYIWTARLFGSPYTRAVGLGAGAGLCGLTAVLQFQAGALIGPGVWAITSMAMLWSAFVLLRKG